ncbi:tetratricopeptide repeat protein [Flavivirga algicola]|uniref:Tetratricopeptide repeat protein n=1 Tax=Flavivirga algicola TaxID=2729136 RepID=A0ABX1RT80_9FLAO|nr:tetratricopeptide repeat protein [Flavivirga algicola]NMH86761.1 hypothetical protein [Flavivirga algicola]
MKEIGEIKEVKGIEEIRKHIGIHQINLAGTNKELELQDAMPIFIFDYLSMSKPLRTRLAIHTCELSGNKFGSLDMIWVDGYDKILKEDLSSLENDSNFWFWDSNGLIPFAYIGKGAEKGPFSEHEGVLFLDATNNFRFEENHTGFEDMPIVLFHVEKDNEKLVPIADNFKALKIVKNKTDRQLSEQIKQEGNALFGEGDFEAAAEKFYEAIQADYTNPNPYNNLGMISQATRDYWDRGETFFQLSFLVDPKYTDGMRGYSGFPASRGDFEGAIKIMTKCVEIEKSALNYAILSRFYLDSGDIENAKKFYKEGAQIDPNHPKLLEVEESLEEHSF